MTLSEIFCRACQKWKSTSLFCVAGFDPVWLGTVNFDKRCKECVKLKKEIKPVPSNERIHW